MAQVISPRGAHQTLCSQDVWAAEGQTFNTGILDFFGLSLYIGIDQPYRIPYAWYSSVGDLQWLVPGPRERACAWETYRFLHRPSPIWSFGLFNERIPASKFALWRISVVFLASQRKGFISKFEFLTKRQPIGRAETVIATLKLSNLDKTYRLKCKNCDAVMMRVHLGGWKIFQIRRFSIP